MLKTKLKQFKREEGFTLIEMSLVLFVISALLLLFIPNLSGRQNSAETKSNEAIETVLQSQVDLYIMDNDSKPSSFDVLKDKNYLTAKQLDRADKEFNLVNGTVSRKTD